ncbi:hypothetical protein [Ilumatobacter coccineus]|uniref:Uncharacterized protein n=1 Tax=Ilumatobacter coccineus (strain NBRC 103263 / KCTC 29153 / YM16-304) TaxID=1313172 RepID=A0A6C7E3F9_ILUCY|nr:hypothetical protein [Ilumatobacter coccineus]BAN01251.1 hypothetical protein YM304_09370 [Ilumatobacter coccineus YM16-304]
MTTVDFSRLHPAGLATWTAIGRLVASTDTQAWAVVGGQMAAIHATIWGVDVPRATDDGDIVVDVRSHTRAALRNVADALVADGFGSEQSSEGIVRFVKGDAKIDLLAPDGLGRGPVETGKGRVVQAPGATQAVKRAEPVIVELATARFEVRTPNLLGAIIAKSAAATEVISASRFDKQKHERDLATLLMCAARDSSLEQWAEAMTKKDRKRLTAARRAFHDAAHPCWSDGANRSDLEAVLSLLLG